MTADQFNHWWDVAVFIAATIVLWKSHHGLSLLAKKGEVREEDKAALGLALLTLLVVYSVSLGYLLYNAKHVLHLIFVA